MHHKDCGMVVLSHTKGEGYITGALNMSDGNEMMKNKGEDEDM